MHVVESVCPPLSDVTYAIRPHAGDYREDVTADTPRSSIWFVQGGSVMTVIERLYDNAWYVANASPAARDLLAADVTRAWMDCEAAREDAMRARTVADLSPARSALALSLSNSRKAGYDRARARAVEAARCTDIVLGHAFNVKRDLDPSGAMTIEISSCTLLRRASLRTAGRGAEWSALLQDPQRRNRESFPTTLGTDPWEAFHQACEWIVSGQL